jgi:PAS domain S-box-containing protein
MAFVAVAILLRWSLDSVLGDRLALATLYGAVALAVWYGGWRPAALATVLGYLVSDYLFIQPRGNIGGFDTAQGVGALAYLLSCSIIIWFGNHMQATRRRAEESAREATQQREQFRVTLASIGDAVIATDRFGRIDFLNPVAVSLTGWPEKEAIGRPLPEVFSILNEHTRQPVENPVDRAIRSGAAVGLANHTILVSKDGRERAIDDSAAPIRGEDGEISGVILVFRDVTERRREQLAQHQLAAIVESSDDAIIGKDLDGIITTWNRAAQRLYGYRPDEIVGKSKSLLIPPDRPDELRGILDKIRHAMRVEPYETVRVRKDGRRVDVSITVSPVRNEVGEIVGAATIARDIGERKRAEAALREADRKKDEFLATLAHELRNPLAPLSNALKLLRLARENRATSEPALELMERQLQHLTRLVDDLLDVSRITHGSIELRRERVELGAVIRSALETSRPVVEQSAHILDVKLPQTPLYLDADQTRLAQVFANLLNNAAKYTKRGGHIWFSAEPHGGDAVVKVRDDGIGIPVEALSRIFDIFTQVDRSLERTQGGLGIGLSLVRSLVELHGGSVQAYSAGPGQGSEFTVRLPLSRQATGTAVSPEDVGRQPSPPRRVLVVDDNRDAADSLALLLELNGHEVRTAYDGLAGVELARKFHPHVVLLDIGLPGLNGYDAARAMREEAQGGGVVLVATTGWGHENDKRRAREAGFDLHLTKPISLDALDSVLNGSAVRAN